MKKIYLLTIIVLVIFTSLLFIWFEVRPAIIKHNCSWTQVHINARPANPGVTQEEANKKKQNCLDECAKDVTKICFCKYLNYNAQPATPEESARDYRIPATKDKYEFCLHNKGL